VRKVLLGAALAAAVLVPAAWASSTASVKLALVPVPKSALGSAARNLPIARDSGVANNAEEASNASGDVSPKQLRRLGRITGYLLDYGNPFGSSAGVREVQTEIELYRSSTAAHKGLGFWRRQEVQEPDLKGLGIHFSLKRLRLSGLPKPDWAYAQAISIKGLKPIQGVDAEFQHGPYLLDVSVAAGSTAAAARLVPTLARHFYKRLQLALSGGLHANPVKLPSELKPGPPPHGPKPSALVLRTADLGQGSKVLQKGYSKPKSSFDKNALSVYGLTIASQATFPVLSQQVLVGASTLEVQYFGAIAIAGAAAGSGKANPATPVDLSGVGDNARGELLQVAVNGQKVNEALVVLTHGSYLDFVVEASPTAFTAAKVQSLAQVAAKRLNSGFAG
jgi:hypothetical protein